MPRISALTAMLLDDTKALNEIDRSGVLRTMTKTATRLVAPADATSTCKGKFRGIENVVLGGIGGSGIVGDILSDYCREVTKIPVSVCRVMRIPRSVGKHTLFVTVSHSGDTTETLGQLEQAMNQGAQVVAISSGGNCLQKQRMTAYPTCGFYQTSCREWLSQNLWPQQFMS
jgi:fructoselysine-6-P-deglycase FrlB-like protein